MVAVNYDRSLHFFEKIMLFSTLPCHPPHYLMDYNLPVNTKKDFQILFVYYYCCDRGHNLFHVRRHGLELLAS